MNSLFCAMTKKDISFDINGHNADSRPLYCIDHGVIGEKRHIA